jgi:hypothetical protein
VLISLRVFDLVSMIDGILFDKLVSNKFISS